MAEGKIVLSDRYVISSLVYQALELPIDWVRSLNQHAPEPDLTLLVDLEVSEAEARRSKRGGPEEIFDANETQLRLRDAYLNCAKDYQNTQIYWQRYHRMSLRDSSRLSTYTFRLKTRKAA